MKRLFALVLLVPSFVVATAAESTFTSTLGPDELSAAGIEGLTPAQIERLNALVERYKSAEVNREVGKAVTETRAKTRDDDEKARSRIESRIAGEFRGWSGGTIFRLENGEEWQLSNPETFRLSRPKMNPSVVIVKAPIAGYMMYVEGCPRVRVRRID
jgi:hypothetical protein